MNFPSQYEKEKELKLTAAAISSIPQLSENHFPLFFFSKSGARAVGPKQNS